MKKLFTTCFFLLAAVMVVFAQNSVKGTVVDAESNDPLIGVSVLVKGTLTGTISDFDGNFEINFPDKGDYTLIFSYTGYEDMEKDVSVDGTADLGTVELAFGAVGLREIEVVASVAIDRRTPVAVSTISGEKIEALVGNQEYPEILRKSPSVYVTKSGGGFGDSRINVRGFDQRNTAVMINGIPVNDMENGWVYWSNWAGLSDVTSRIDFQRGLGASKLVVPAVGGSINIVTNAADMKKGGVVSAGIGNDGYQKYGLVLSSGLGEKGWAFTVQGTHTRGNGYINGTAFSAFSYFASLTKRFNNEHMISFTALGAPQWHHQRFIPGRFDGVTLRTFVDPDGLPDEGGYGYNNGAKFNWLSGELDGEEFSWRKNFYHKPKAFLNHYWTISENTDLKTSAYISLGRGGGTGPRGRLAGMFDSDTDFRNADGVIQFDDIVAYNSGQATSFGTKDPDDNGTYTTTSSGDGFIRRASMNSHNWLGIYSTLTHRLNSNLTLTAGLDGRYYRGIHYRRLENLLGNSGYISRADDNNPSNLITEESPADFGNYSDNSYIDGNNVLNYHNDGLVRWLGLFGQIEYSKDALSVFVSATGSHQGFKRIDFFNYLDSDDAQTSDWQSFMGGTVKVGANYNVSASSNIFVNGGYFSRQPIFDNVFINFRNDVNEDAKNQSVIAFEAGYGFRSKAFRAKLNGYYTQWGNRQFDVSIDNAMDEEILYNFENVSQTHMGVELEFTALPVSWIELNGMLSIGNWEYSSDFEAQGFNLDQNKPEGSLTIFADGLKVGDAAQTTASIGATLKPAQGLRIYADYYFASNLFANYSVDDSQFQNPGGEVAELPSYSLVDAGLSYNFDLAGLNLTARFNMNNVLDTEYVSEMNTSILDDPSTPNVDEFYDNRGVFGFGRTWNAGLKIRF